MLNNSTIENRTIFCHDNLDILRGINSDCIDLIYLDPPFNKKKVFTAPIGSSADGASFRDIFREEDVKDDWLKEIKEDYYAVHDLLSAVKIIEGRTSYNFCYLAYMAIRLMECHRVLKDTGSLYLHCDVKMSHYLKLLLDCIFGENNFRNEVIWHYRGTGSPKTKFPAKHDSILFYAKNKNKIYFKKIKVLAKKKSGWTGKTEKACDTVWDINTVYQSAERKHMTKYPTQKPVTLLERVIDASCPAGGIVLDPFCGCATTCIAAEKMERQWIGIDISQKAYDLVKGRLGKEIELTDDLFYEELVKFKTSPPTRTDMGNETRPQKYVYIISNKQYENEWKVGIASNAKARLNSYQTSDPNRWYEMEYSFLTPHFREIEEYIHEKYENRYEWVRGNKADIINDIENYEK
ncbi:MAG: GIY-YIG nuclease family protein [Proteobacteria bacterium]|nr:GIY-YIG nuclease family protein [Pseudomonadota bacterium]